MSDQHSRGQSPDALVPQLESELRRAARRGDLSPTTPRPAGRARAGLWRSPVIVAVLVVAAFGTVAIAMAAQGLFPPGGPVALPSGYPLQPHSGLGLPVPGSSGGVPFKVPDPAAGLDWGARFIVTTRGYGCLQIGRVQRGQLGVIGQDYAFHNDGRFHTLPLDYLDGPFPCAALDADGHAFAGVYINGAPASAQLVDEACTARGGLTHTGQPQCPAKDMRLVMAGMAGPLARTITYTDVAGDPHTVNASGPQGIYLIVLRAPAKLGLEGGEYEPGPPGIGLIRRITYANGQSCNPGQLESRNSQGCRDIGERPVQQRGVNASSVRSPITVRLKNERVQMRYKAETVPMFAISFRAPVAVTSGASEYVVSLRCRNIGTIGPTLENIRRGQIVTQNVAQNGCHGPAHIRVAYVTAGGAAGLPLLLDRPGYTVGTSTIDMP